MMLVRWFREPWQWMFVNGNVLVLTWKKTRWMREHETESPFHTEVAK